MDEENIIELLEFYNDMLCVSTYSSSIFFSNNLQLHWRIIAV